MMHILHCVNKCIWNILVGCQQRIWWQFRKNSSRLASTTEVLSIYYWLEYFTVIFDQRNTSQCGFLFCIEPRISDQFACKSNVILVQGATKIAEIRWEPEGWRGQSDRGRAERNRERKMGWIETADQSGEWHSEQTHDIFNWWVFIEFFHRLT